MLDKFEHNSPGVISKFIDSNPGKMVLHCIWFSFFKFNIF